MVYEPLHHKYRPQTFGDLVGQDAIAKTLINAILSRRIAPAYLFTGPRGTGKTSSARILAKSLNCLSSPVPTPTPCGQCEVCRAIAVSSALDVIEIDAASNTGVDHIRELIERSQFAPVQCRYKVYVIDECLTGDSLVTTKAGLMRIDDPDLKGKEVLSYNESSRTWEYKRVLRWIERGIKPTLTIQTTHQKICCTDNHLIRTEQGWIKAQNIKKGMQILSPVNADVAYSSTDTEPMDVFGDLSQDISSKKINTDKNPTISPLFWNKLKPSNLIAPVDVKKNSIFPCSSNKKVEELKALNLIGQDIPTRKDMDCGNDAQKTLSQTNPFYPQTVSDLSMEHSWEMEVSTTLTHTVDFLDYDGHTVYNNENGWNIKPNIFGNYNPSCELSLIKDMESNQFVVKPFVIHNLEKSSTSSDPRKIEREYPWNGFPESHQKDLLGGTWMMVPLASLKQGVPAFNSIQKAFPNQKINLSLNGLQNWDIPQQQNHILEKTQRKPITTIHWESKHLENGSRICDNIRFPQWITSSETVESVEISEIEKVYDIEVEDNHNFIANGLLVHNCHMLSTAAFNALLKTLEEPPDRVIFVLATTDSQRVLPTIISRCQRFDYRRIPLQDMVDHLSKIAHQETIDVDPEAVTLIAQIANGGLRDAESLLDQLSLLAGTITPEKVWELVGAVPEQDLLTLLQAIHSNDPEKVIEQCRHLMNRGREPLVVLQNLASFYLNLLIAKTAPHRPDLVAVTAPTWQNLRTESSQWDLPEILRGQQYLRDSESQIKNTTQPRLWLEVTLLGLLSGVRATTTLSIPVVTSHAVTSIPVVTPTPKPESLPTPVQAVEPIGVEPEPVTPSTTQNLDLEQIWSQVLRVVQPMATQSLLKEHGSLLSFNGSVADISIASEPLMKMARPRITNMEEALTKVCRQPVKVNLQVASSPTATPPTKAITPPPSQAAIPVKPPEIVAPKLVQETKTSPIVVEPVAVIPAEPLAPAKQDAVDSANDEITAAAESLAKLFDGEIVAMDSQDTEDETVIEVQVNKTLLSGRPDTIDVADEEDIPF